MAYIKGEIKRQRVNSNTKVSIDEVSKNMVGIENEKLDIDNIELSLDDNKKEMTKIDLVSGITVTHIGDKIFDVGTHVVFTRYITFSEYINNSSQVEVPEGYRLISLNINNAMLRNNYAVFENNVAVKVKVYKMQDGKEFSPEFGTPLL